MHPNSQRLFENHARSCFKSEMRVLEVAPEAHPSALCRSVGNLSIRWESINLEPKDSAYVVQRSKEMIVTNDPYRYPIPDETYDVVVSANVFEHVPKPWCWMKELGRVCKKGGYVVTVAPLNWGYHPEPIDCWRAYPDAMRAVYEAAGLTVERTFVGSTDTWRSRANVAGLKYIVKKLIGRPLHGEPWLPVDTICVGVKR